MHSERDMTRIVRTWLRTDDHEPADRLLAEVLVLVDTTTQNRSPRVVRRLAESSWAARLGITAAAVLVVAVGATSVLPLLDGRIGPLSSSTPSTVPSPSVSADPGTEYSAIEPGSHEVSWRQWRIRMTVPEGWMSAKAGWSQCGPVPCWLPQGGATITPYGLEGGSPDLTLSLGHDVVAVVEDVCAGSPKWHEVPVGPTVDDLVTAIENLEGVGRTGPTDVTLGGFPAKRFVMTLPAPGQPGCPGPDGHGVWSNATAYGFSILDGGSATVYVVDVGGDRLVITSVERGATAEHLAELDAIVASMEIERDPSPTPATVFPEGELGVGRHSFTVAGVPMSVEVSTRDPENTGWASNGAFLFSKSITGPQGAEAAILWTSYPDPGYPLRCRDVLETPPAASAADVAAAVARALADPARRAVPGEVTLGGRPAHHVVLTLGNDTGCRPGVFWTWPDIYGGPLWGITRPGDTIQVWILEVDGVLLFIEALTTTQATAALEGELEMFIDSIAFE